MVEISIPTFHELRSSSEGPLHIVFMVHFWLASWSMLGYWSANKLLIQDVFLLLCLMWSIHEKQSSSPVFLALFIDALSVLLDIIIIATYYPTGSGHTEHFSAIMAIFNLLFRLISVVMIYRCWQLRNDGTDVGLPRPHPPSSSQPPSVISSSHYGHHQAPVSHKNFNGEPAYGYTTSYQQPAALHGPRQDLPAIPPSYSQHN